ncbi:MAG: type II toxin-antitoxin system HicA family toxin [Chloroflexi bacterium]|nr:type II toxin-antitoxin system HicA family toxin [Chloroflexota bacterium]
MRLPRDVSGDDLVRRLRRLGYEQIRQRGSHMRITTQVNGRHSDTVPGQRNIRPGLLNSILKRVADHHSMTVEELLDLLDL